MTTAEESFSGVFSRALRGLPCAVHGLGAEPEPLPVAAWTRDPDPADRALLRRCRGATLDIGCGPGRLSAALAAAGHVVLGIDVVHEAVGQARDRGAPALRRDVFDPLPGEGRWTTALLADGNIGIGGDPAALLRRVRELLDPRGRVVAELAPPGVPATTAWAVLQCEGRRSRPFRWSVLGVDDVEDLAAGSGLQVAEVHDVGADPEQRWVAVLEERR